MKTRTPPAPHPLRAIVREQRRGIILTGGAGLLGVAGAVAFHSAVRAIVGADCVDILATGGPCPALEDPTRSGQLVTTVLVYTQLLGLVPFASFALGAIVGAPLFARELQSGTHTLALTQSVSSTRWWATKTAVAGIPLVLALLAIGEAVRWSVSIFVPNDDAGTLLDAPLLLGSSIVPAAIGLTGFALAATLGVFLRRTVSALVAAVAVGAVIAIAVPTDAPLDLVPTERTVTSLDGAIADVLADPWVRAPGERTHPQNHLYVRSNGYLNAEGEQVLLDPSPCETASEDAVNELINTDAGYSMSWDETFTVVLDDGGPLDADTTKAIYEASHRAYEECVTASGATHWYTDALTSKHVWPVRLALSGILAAASLAVLAVGAWRLRTSVSRR